MTAAALPRYSLGEEIANAVTHGPGILLAIAGLAVPSDLLAVIWSPAAAGPLDAHRQEATKP